MLLIIEIIINKQSADFFCIVIVEEYQHTDVYFQAHAW